jgi:hypothetical protein
MTQILILILIVFGFVVGGSAMIESSDTFKGLD